MSKVEKNLAAQCQFQSSMSTYKDKEMFSNLHSNIRLKIQFENYLGNFNQSLQRNINMSVGAANFSSFHPEFFPEVNIEPCKVIPKLLRVVTSTNSTLYQTQSAPALLPVMLKCSSLLSAILMFTVETLGLCLQCTVLVLSYQLSHCNSTGLH